MGEQEQGGNGRSGRPGETPSRASATHSLTPRSRPPFPRAIPSRASTSA